MLSLSSLRCQTWSQRGSVDRGSARRVSVCLVTLDEVEAGLRARLGALGPAPRAELLHVLMLPDFDRADRIGEFWGYPESRAFAELLIDCEEDRVLRAVLVGMLREGDAGIRNLNGWRGAPALPERPVC